MAKMNLENIFSYHPAKGDQGQRYDSNRTACLLAAQVIDQNCPDSPEKTLAIRKLQEAMFYANAAIAINE
jgi:hypothetical protein